MKLLLDACVWGGAVSELRAAGHDVVWAGDWPEDPGDDEILHRAHADRRILVTLDKDFGELAIVRKHPHSGIVRLVGLSALEQGGRCHTAVLAHGPELQRGGIATVERTRIRVRPPSAQKE